MLGLTGLQVMKLVFAGKYARNFRIEQWPFLKWDPNSVYRSIFIPKTCRRLVIKNYICQLVIVFKINE